MTLFFVALAQLLLFLGYTYFIKQRYGILGSVSASTYSLEGKERYIFWAVLSTIAVLNLLHGFGFLAGVASIGLVIAGTTIEHRSNKDDLEDDIHTWGTVGAIVATYAMLAIQFSFWPMIIYAVYAGTTYKIFKLKNFIWWVEIVGLAIATITYMIIHWG